MKFWLSKNGDFSIREQLTRQVILAIVSGDLQPGDRLPSVREIALRHKIHPNTASAAYRRLEEDGWVASRVGSGVYVREIAAAKLSDAARSIECELDEMVSSFLAEARRRGFNDKQIKARLNRNLRRKSARRILIVEKDPHLARIFAHELAEKFPVPVEIAGDDEKNAAKRALVVSLSDPFESFSAAAFVRLKLNSVHDAMRGQEKPRKTDLIGIASHWEVFLRWSQTMLAAVGIPEENMVVRDACAERWQNGLRSCRFVITDILTAERLPEGVENRVFRLISAKTLTEIENRLG